MKQHTDFKYLQVLRQIWKVNDFPIKCSCGFQEDQKSVRCGVHSVFFTIFYICWWFSFGLIERYILCRPWKFQRNLIHKLQRKLARTWPGPIFHLPSIKETLMSHASSSGCFGTIFWFFIVLPLICFVNCAACGAGLMKGTNIPPAPKTAITYNPSAGPAKSSPPKPSSSSSTKGKHHDL